MGLKKGDITNIHEPEAKKAEQVLLSTCHIFPSCQPPGPDVPQPSNSQECSMPAVNIHLTHFSKISGDILVC